MYKFLLGLSTNPFLQNSLVLFMGTMVVNILNYIFHVVIGRVVTPEMYGEIESLISLFTIISVPAATITLIATKYAASLKAERNVRGTGELIKAFNKKILLYTGPVFLAVFLATPWVKDFLKIPTSLPLVFLWITMFLSFLSAVTVGLLTGWQRFRAINKVNITNAVTKLIVALLLVYLGFGVSGAIGSLVIAAIFSYGISLIALKYLYREEEHVTSVGEMTKLPLRGYILPAFYGTLSVAILGNADIVFAKHQLDPIAAGEYGALSIAAKSIFFVTGVLSTVMFAMSSAEKNNAQKGRQTFWLALGLTALVSFGSTLLFFLFPEFVLSVFFGNKYSDQSTLLAWFALAATWYALANIFLQYLLSIGATAIAYLYLCISVLELVVLWFFGTNLHAIIIITIGTQIVASVGGFFFVWTKKNG